HHDVVRILAGGAIEVGDDLCEDVALALAQSQEGYSEAIKNQAGVQATNSSGSSNDSFSIRCIKLNLFSNYRLDGGLPVTGVITNPTENKERVETLKGANALMFGVASPAGIINFVTRRGGER